MVSTAATKQFLAAPWLAELDPASRHALLDVLIEDRAEAGAVLLEQGQYNDHLSFLIEGSVSVERAYPERPVEIVARLAAPSVFGESSFFRSVTPIVSIRAVTPVWFLTLDHPSHDQLRRDDPRAAEQLAVAAVRVLAERFDQLDRRVSEYVASRPEGHPRATEWSNFRARLFEESKI